MTVEDDLRYGPPGAPSSRPPLVLAGTPVLALVGSLVVGALVGTATGALLLRSTAGSDGWAQLGAVVVGLLAGVVTAASTYAAALVLLARRLFSRGHRAVPVLLSVAGPLVVAGWGALLESLRLTVSGERAVQTLLVVAAVACAPAAFLVCGAPRPARVAGVWVVAAAAVCAGGVAAASHAVHQAQEARVVARLPLVLFDGDTADPAYPRWRRDPFRELSVHEAHSFTDRGREGYLKYFTPDGVVFLTLHTQAGPCSAPASGYACSSAGRLPDGELRLYTRATPYGSYPRADRFLALVYPDGSAVSLNIGPGSTGGRQLDVQEGRSALAALRRVDRARFEARSGTRVTVP